MIRLTIQFDPATGNINVEAPPGLSPAVANALLDLAKGACVQVTVQQLQKQAAVGISRPTPEQVTQLVGVR